MEIQIKEKFIEVTSSEGKYIVDEENFFGTVVYFPIDYDTSKLCEITEEEKVIFESIHQEQIKAL